LKNIENMSEKVYLCGKTFTSMNYEKYQLKSVGNLTTFEFVSVGKKGKVKKLA
jgi:hypothetical protein